MDIVNDFEFVFKKWDGKYCPPMHWKVNFYVKESVSTTRQLKQKNEPQEDEKKELKLDFHLKVVRTSKRVKWVHFQVH